MCNMGGHHAPNMPRFFCDNIINNKPVISGEDAKHISKVLRMRVGDVLTINDMQGFDYECEIEDISDIVSLNVVSKKKNQTEPTVKITLFQCLPKGDKLDFIIQKAVELGAYRIVPVTSKFCVAKADSEGFSKKLQRLNKIALEAAKQSGRGIIPEVLNILTFKEAVEIAKAECKRSLICYEGGGERIFDAVSVDDEQVFIFVGSEGGFSEEEIKLAAENGIIPVTLGKLILRCETAPIASITLVLNKTLNM